MEKDYIFYSQYCNYCRTLLSYIKDNNLMENLELMCIDGKRNQLPHFVKCVPTLFTKNKEVLTENDIKSYLETKEIQCFSLNNNKCSFTFLSDDNNIANSDTFERINFEQDNKKYENNENKISESMLDNYMMSRKNDDNFFLQKNKSN